MEQESEPGGPVRARPAGSFHRPAASIEGEPRKLDSLLGIGTGEGIVFLALLFAVQSTTNYYNYLLFHAFSELFCIVIAAMIAVITANCASYIKNRYLILIGISYASVAVFDLLHTLSFKGMPVFTDYNYYAPQFWIAARYVESASMLAGLGLLKTKARISPLVLAGVYLAVTAGLIASILYYKVFPVCFIPGQGLTSFKLISEYIICALLIASIALLYVRRAYFDELLFRQLLTSAVLMVCTELCFTLYVSDAMSDAFNEAGHLLKICAFFIIYKALAVTAVREPLRLLFRELAVSEQRLREAQQLARLGRWELDLSTKEWTWTEEMRRFFAVEPSSPPSLGAMLKPLSLDDRERLRGLLSRLASWGAPFELMLRIEVPGEKARFGQLRGEAIRGRDGAVAGLAGTLQDVTEQQLLIEELRERTAQLEQRRGELVIARDAAEAGNNAKSAFLAGMSHDLRSPLGAILGFSSLMLRDQGISARYREAFGCINSAAGRLLTSINGVLEMAKIETGRLQLKIAPLDLHRLARGVAEATRARAQEKGLQFELKQSPSFPRFIKGDEARLRQILLNVAGAAVQFTDEGSVTIRLRSRPGGNGHLIMEVEDTGRGFTPEEQKRLLQPFAQGAEPGSPNVAGQRLALAGQLARSMGGALGLESAPGKGSTFRIELPAEVIEEDAAASAGRAAAAAQAGEVLGLAPGQPEFRILIAEDARENRLLLARLMKNAGLSVRAVRNGEQCVALAQRWRPHFIWMDRRMPVMEGPEAARRIRQLPGGDGVKIVAVIPSALEEVRRRLLDAGMDDTLLEPYTIDEVYACLARHLGVKFLHRSEGAPAGADGNAAQSAGGAAGAAA